MHKVVYIIQYFLNLKMKHLAAWIVAPGIGFRILLPTAHRSTLLRRKFRLISCRSLKIGEEERSILKGAQA
jgi:hypothetical protein